MAVAQGDFRTNAHLAFPLNRLPQRVHAISHIIRLPAGACSFLSCGGGAGNRTRVRAGSFRSSTCVAVLSLSRPPRFVRHFAVAAQSLFGFPPAPVTGAIGESPNDVRPQFGDALG